MRCDFCAKETQVKKVQKYRYVDSELENVFLDNIEIRFCSNCALESPIVPKILKLHNTIASAVVCKKALLNGAEIQFLRKNLRFRSQNWAKLLRTDKSVYSRWEGSQKISPQSDLLIRLLYLRLLEEEKNMRLEKKIVEDLSEPTSEQTAIIIDVENIESYSYMPIAEALHLAEIQNRQKMTFDFDLEDKNLFLSEIEEPLPFKDSTGNDFKSAAATANHELALAA